MSIPRSQLHEAPEVHLRVQLPLLRVRLVTETSREGRNETTYERIEQVGEPRKPKVPAKPPAGKPRQL